MGAAQAHEAAEAAGARMEPPVSEPSAMSAGLPATAARRAGGRTAGNAVRRCRIDRIGEMRILPHQGKGKFVGLCLADKFRPGGERPFHHGADLSARGDSASICGLPHPVTIPATTNVFTASRSPSTALQCVNGRLFQLCNDGVEGIETGHCSQHATINGIFTLFRRTDLPVECFTNIEQWQAYSALRSCQK